MSKWKLSWAWRGKEQAGGRKFSAKAPRGQRTWFVKEEKEA